MQSIIQISEVIALNVLPFPPHGEKRYFGPNERHVCINHHLLHHVVQYFTCL